MTHCVLQSTSGCTSATGAYHTGTAVAHERSLQPAARRSGAPDRRRRPASERQRRRGAERCTSRHADAATPRPDVARCLDAASAGQQAATGSASYGRAPMRPAASSRRLSATSCTTSPRSPHCLPGVRLRQQGRGRRIPRDQRHEGPAHSRAHAGADSGR